MIIYGTMNVSDYIKREKRPPPKIHEKAYIEEFQNPDRFGLKSGDELDAAKDIKGGRVYDFRPANIPFADWKAAAAHTMGGEHPWEVFGNFGEPLNLPLEAPYLYNPKGLNDEQFHIAKWQDQEGVINDFAQRQLNIETGVPLTDIKDASKELEGAVDYKTGLEAVKKSIAEQFSDVTPLERKFEEVEAVKKFKSKEGQKEHRKKQFAEKIKAKTPVRVEPINYDRSPKPKAVQPVKGGVKLFESDDDDEPYATPMKKTPMKTPITEDEADVQYEKLSELKKDIEKIDTERKAKFGEEGKTRGPYNIENDTLNTLRKKYQEFGIELPKELKTVRKLNKFVAEQLGELENFREVKAAAIPAQLQIRKGAAAAGGGAETKKAGV